MTSIKRLVLPCLLLSTNAMASTPPLYVGIQAGETISHYNAYKIGLNTADVRNYAFGGRVFAAWQFTRELAVELGYFYLRPIRVRDINGNTNRGKIRSNIIDVSLKARWPLEHGYAIYGRFGAGYHTAKPSDSIRNASQNDYRWAHVNHVRPIMGLGVTYQVNKSIELDAGWTHILNHRALPALDVITLGAVWRVGTIS